MNTDDQQKNIPPSDDKRKNKHKENAIAVNPNPKANANIQDQLSIDPELTNDTNEVGSEITDGEDG